jgi:hypothetical protein
VVVSASSFTSGHDLSLRIFQTNTSASLLNVDNCYLELGRTDAPDAWCSSHSLLNRNDPEESEGNIDYLDTWGIPGDVPPIVDMAVAITDGNSSADYSVLAVSQHSDGYYLVTERDKRAAAAGEGLTVWEGENLNVNDSSNVTPSPTSDSGRHSGYYMQNTASAADAWIEYYHQAIDADTSVSASLNARYFAVWRASSQAITLTWRWAMGILEEWIDVSGPFSVQTVDTWEVVDLGTFLPAEFTPEQTWSASWGLLYLIENMPNASTVDIDVIRAYHLDPGDSFLVVKPTTRSPSVVNVWGRKKNVTSQYSAAVSYLGGLWEVAAGNVMTRRSFLDYSPGTLDHYLSSSFTVDLDITPRTRHLLGTV